METRKALETLLLGEREYRRLFKQCCESGLLRLRSQAWQFRDELCDRGHEHSLEDIEDTLWELARDLLPELTGPHSLYHSQ